MSVLRARTACPKCSAEEEVWYYKGAVAFADATECNRCSYVYHASDFILCLLDLYQNVTVSANSILYKSK